MASGLVCTRIPHPSPIIEAFADRTEEWLADFEKDFRRMTGAPVAEPSSVRLASDFLVRVHGEEASWERFDVVEYEAQLRALPARLLPRAFVPSFIASMAAFTAYLAARGAISSERYHETLRHALALRRTMLEARRSRRVRKRKRKAA